MERRILEACLRQGSSVHSYLEGDGYQPWMGTYVRNAYDYLRNFGLARIGLFGEGCTTGDMTTIAVRLSELGVGEALVSVLDDQRLERQRPDLSPDLMPD
jgi:hypothetical protein